VCHAEINAVLNKNSSNVKDCTIYVALFPCNQCAKVIIQSGIKTVIYMSDKYAHKVETIASKRMFEAAGVKYRCLLFGIVASFISIDRRDLMAFFFIFFRQYIPKNKKIEINFSDINWTEMNQLPQTPTKQEDLKNENENRVCV